MAGADVSMHSGESLHGTGAIPVEALELFAEVLSQSEQDPAHGDGFYDRLCEAVCRLARLRRAAIFRYEPESRQVLSVGAHGVDLRRFEGVPVSLESAPLAIRAIREDRVIEAAGDIRKELPPEYASLISEPVRLVCAPMSAAGRGVGVIVAERSLEAPALDATERHLLWTLGKAAALASVARAVATQAAAARQLGQRIDLAREVHEGVIQRLFGVSMVLDGEGDLPAQMRARCAAETQMALTELREAIQRPLGRPPRATPLRFAEELHLQIGLHPEMVIQHQSIGEVPAELDPLAQSVLAEALRNVRKHAHANAVSVRTECGTDAFTLEVINDGVEGSARRRPGMGLRLAGFEALQAGGVVEFGPAGAGSWRVRLVVPIGAAE